MEQWDAANPSIDRPILELCYLLGLADPGRSQQEIHMTPPEVEYDLHDSTIVSVSTGPRREVSVTIDLYPIFYPNKQRIQLRFGGIDNFDTVQRYVETIRQEADDDDYIGCRIDAFHYDTKKESKAGDYWFYFQTDWCGPVRVHCSKMSMTELHSGSCEQSDAREPSAQSVLKPKSTPRSP